MINNVAVSTSGQSVRQTVDGRELAEQVNSESEDTKDDIETNRDVRVKLSDEALRAAEADKKNQVQPSDEVEKETSSNRSNQDVEPPEVDYQTQQALKAYES